MKVLISGSNGMIGSVVAPYLASQGHVQPVWLGSGWYICESRLYLEGQT